MCIRDRNREKHKGFIVVSSGNVEEKVYSEAEKFDSFDDVSIIRLESSYDNYFGSFVLAPRVNLGRIEIDLVAVGIPSESEHNSEPKLYKITKRDVSDFMTMKKNNQAESKEVNKKIEKRTSKRKRKKLFGII